MSLITRTVIDLIIFSDKIVVVTLFLEVVVQTTTYIQFAFVVLHSRGGVLGAG